MPRIVYYEVERTQKVMVRATDPEKALMTANAFFENRVIAPDGGSVTSDLGVINVNITQIS